eukprot:s1700_g4.t1
MSGEASEEKASVGLWNQLPSFDPSTDDIREFSQKARFLHGVFPAKDKGNLAPRLAMLCKGTAWSQVRVLDPKKLTDPEDGVDYLLAALSAWEETSELKTFELFERALYKVNQKADEATHSYALRLHAAFDDLGDKVTVKEMQAFVLLRQSGLTNEDKKRVLSMTNGELKLQGVEQAMRTLSTKVLMSSGETKKKIYPTNYVEPEDVPAGHDDEMSMHSTYYTQVDDDEGVTNESLEQLVQAGDADALVVQQFEKDFEDMVQDVPDLHAALLTYQEARQRINDKKRSRGFWPSAKGKSKGFNRDHGSGKGFRKGGPRGGKDELLARISRTHCKACGQIGHWKAECPNRRETPKEQANVVQQEIDAAEPEPHDFPQVIFEELEAGGDKCEECFFVHSSSVSQASVIPISVRRQAIEFWNSRLGKKIRTAFSSLTCLICVTTGIRLQQQLLSLQALAASKHLLDLIQFLQVTMPTRQEVFEGLRVLSEEVIQSLKILFYMIFTLTKAINPEEHVSDQDGSTIQQLVQEVRVQREKITELGQIITNQMLKDPPRRSSGPPSPEPTIGSDLRELMEEEAMLGSGEHQVPSPVGPSSSSPMPMMPPTMPNLNLPAGGSTRKIAGIPLTGRPSKASPQAPQPEASQANQVALTQQALINWGQKKITWGKKHMSKAYHQVYEADSGYVKWVLARVGSLGEDIEDFANYALTRQRLETAALNVP